MLKRVLAFLLLHFNPFQAAHRQLFVDFVLVSGFFQATCLTHTFTLSAVC